MPTIAPSIPADALATIKLLADIAAESSDYATQTAEDPPHPATADSVMHLRAVMQTQHAAYAAWAYALRVALAHTQAAGLRIRCCDTTDPQQFGLLMYTQTGGPRYSLAYVERCVRGVLMGDVEPLAAPKLQTVLPLQITRPCGALAHLVVSTETGRVLYVADTADEAQAAVNASATGVHIPYRPGPSTTVPSIGDTYL